MANELLSRLKKASKIELASTFDKSVVMNQKDMIHLPIPALNIALSGDLDGGLNPGLTMLAGESKTFKCVGGNTKLVVYVDE